MNIVHRIAGQKIKAIFQMVKGTRRGRGAGARGAAGGRRAESAAGRRAGTAGGAESGSGRRADTTGGVEPGTERREAGNAHGAAAGETEVAPGRREVAGARQAGGGDPGAGRRETAGGRRAAAAGGAESGAGRREAVRAALVAAAERAIAWDGLTGLRARDLAREAGCAVGAIYNAVRDLDELILLVNARTLAALERELDAAAAASARATATGASRAVTALARLAITYLDFAAAHTLRWRALFEHRLPADREVPDWYRQEQQRLFGYVEAPLRELVPAMPAADRALLARSLFSAVHGLVLLGLEEKLVALPLRVLREQMTQLVATIGRGLATKA
jgi:AcrR family transcriptional regulator